MIVNLKEILEYAREHNCAIGSWHWACIIITGLFNSSAASITACKLSKVGVVGYTCFIIVLIKKNYQKCINRKKL